MAARNNNVEKIREIYELHGFQYLKQMFDGEKVVLKGHTNPGKHCRDVEILFANSVTTIEIKGSNLIDVNGPRWQRVKLTRKDYDSLHPPDLYLFIYDVSQIGSSNFTICEICDGPCNFIFKMVEATEVHSLVKNKEAEYSSIPISKISQLPKLGVEV